MVPKRDIAWSVHRVALDAKTAMIAPRAGFRMKRQLMRARIVPRDSTKTRKRARFARDALLVGQAAATGQRAPTAKHALMGNTRTIQMLSSVLHAHNVNLGQNLPIARPTVTEFVLIVQSVSFGVTQGWSAAVVLKASTKTVRSRRPARNVKDASLARARGAKAPVLDSARNAPQAST